MKTNLSKADGKFFLPAFGLLFLLLASCPHRAVAQTNTFPQTGNAGVGTLSPTEKLEVVGTVKSSGGVTITGAPAEPAYQNALYLGMTGNTATIDAVDQMVDFRDLVISAKTFRVSTWNGGSLVTGLFQNNNGNVGIGTTTPTSKLHIVSGTDNGTAMLNLDTGVHGGTSMLVYGSANNESGYDLSVYRAGQYFSRFGVSNYGNVYLQPNGGSVGIGTSSPNYRLDVQGGQINSSGGLCIAGDCKTAWSQVGGGGGSQWTTAGSSIYYNTGNVGIGTSSPTAKLHVYGSGNIQGIVQSTTAGAELDLISSATNYGSWGIGTGWSTAGVRSFYLYDNVASATRLMIDASGNVGIGTTTPANKLHVAGSITVDGNINAKYQDVAEWVPASHALPAGTVVTLDPTKANHVEASTHAYDTRVAGVVSAQPGITLGEQSDSKVLVATTGRVRVMVDASHAPIHIGDLLVTSDRPGVAMKSEPITISGRQIHSPGTLLGKALEPLEKGSGKILVLLSLQ